MLLSDPPIVIQTTLFFAFGLSSTGSKSYYKALYGTLLSYGIILYKSYGIPQFNTEYLNRLIRDENTQYFMLALIWTTSAPLSVALIPYATFSLLHILNYTRNEIFSNLVGTSNASINALSQSIGKFVQANHAKAIYFVSNTEFLSFRYVFSPVTKQVVSGLDATLDKYIGSNPSLPTIVRTVYGKARDMIASYGDMEGRARQQQSAGAGAGSSTAPPAAAGTAGAQ
ncbi:hypothetical protein BSLG_003927 [Batrachochytrium salamandrivorans]|nr:hypothetical protein BSLG_003927 [Batrachochytrium salamandrivorans]